MRIQAWCDGTKRKIAPIVTIGTMKTVKTFFFSFPALNSTTMLAQKLLSLFGSVFRKKKEKVAVFLFHASMFWAWFLSFYGNFSSSVVSIIGIRYSFSLGHIVFNICSI